MATDTGETPNSPKNINPTIQQFIQDLNYIKKKINNTILNEALQGPIEILGKCEEVSDDLNDTLVDIKGILNNIASNFAPMILGKKVIITSGDCSDFDGFLALPLYYATGCDVIFMMTYPQYLREDLNSDSISGNLKLSEDINPPITDDVNSKDPYICKSGLGYRYSFAEWKSKRNNSAEDPLLQKLNTHTEYKKALDLTTKTIIRNIWSWCSENIEVKPPPKIYFVEGGYNTFNPFSPSKIKNEVDVYNVYKCRVTKDFFTYNIDNVLTALKDVDNIYIDMNGSMAWYPNFKGKLSKSGEFDEFKKKVRACVVMGGVEIQNSIDTMSSVPGVLNRFSTATMNQLYHPKGTKQFFDDFEKNLYFVSNNEINRVFSWTKKESEYNNRADKLDISKNLVNITDIMNDYFSNLDNFKSDINGILKEMISGLEPDLLNTKYRVIDFFSAYYGSNDRKPFDLLSAYRLCQIINNTIEEATDNIKDGKIEKQKLLYNDQYGISILVNDLKSDVETEETTLKEFLNDGFPESMNDKNENNPSILVQNINNNFNDEMSMLKGANITLKKYDVKNIVGYKNTVLKDKLSKAAAEAEAKAKKKQQKKQQDQQQKAQTGPGAEGGGKNPKMVPLANTYHLAKDGKKRKVFIMTGSKAHYVKYKGNFVRKSELDRMIKKSK